MVKWNRNHGNLNTVPSAEFPTVERYWVFMAVMFLVQDATICVRRRIAVQYNFFLIWRFQHHGIGHHCFQRFKCNLLLHTPTEPSVLFRNFRQWGCDACKVRDESAIISACTQEASHTPHRRRLRKVCHCLNVSRVCPYPFLAHYVTDKFHWTFCKLAFLEVQFLYPPAPLS